MVVYLVIKFFCDNKKINMNISISIMAHPSRKEFFTYLKERLGDVPISIDEGCGIWENCKQDWRLHDPKADYHIVIQDDAIVCDNFIELATKAITDGKEKGCVTSLFFGKRKLLQDIAEKGIKDGFVIRDMLHWGIAVCLPVNLIEEMISYGNTKNIDQDDTRISYFLQSKKIKIYYPIPSLIDHRHGESLVKDPGKFRSAYKYIDEKK